MNDAIETIAAKAMQASGSGDIVPSPCVAVCRMDALTGLCLGCWRTLDEIRAWSEADRATRLGIWDAVVRRASAALPQAAALASGPAACARPQRGDCKKNCDHCPGATA